MLCDAPSVLVPDISGRIPRTRFALEHTPRSYQFAPVPRARPAHQAACEAECKRRKAAKGKAKAPREGGQGGGGSGEDGGGSGGRSAFGFSF